MTPPLGDDSSAHAPRIVLDTNTVLALWMFRDPTLDRLRTAIEARHCRLHSRGDALEELRRVLAYRQFGLTQAVQTDIHSHYLALLSHWDHPESAEAARLTGALPRCRDADDQKFLEIARLSGASLLLSRDKALLRLSRDTSRRHQFSISTPDRFTLPDQPGG